MNCEFIKRSIDYPHFALKCKRCGGWTSSSITRILALKLLGLLLKSMCCYCIRFYWNLIRHLLQQPIHPLLSEMSVHNNHNYQSAEWREVFGRSRKDQHQKDSFIFIQHSYSVVVDCAQIANTCSRLLLVLFCIAFCSLCAFCALLIAIIVLDERLFRLWILTVAICALRILNRYLFDIVERELLFVFK